MQIKTQAIVLSAIKYQEKSLIVKCFTQSDGLKSYFIPSAFSSKKSYQKIAYFQPLNILEIEANHKNKGTLENFKEIKTAVPFQSIHTDIVKSTMVMFLSEMLHYSIQEEEKNYVKMPSYYSFVDKKGNNRKEEVLMTNFRKINKEVELIVNENIKAA
jgi:DNA repair protein RecO (recombination protein O)